jgi:hypothetical protein
MVSLPPVAPALEDAEPPRRYLSVAYSAHVPPRNEDGFLFS